MTLIIPPGFGNGAFVFSAADGTPPFVTTLGVDLSGWGGDFVGAANYLKAQFVAAFSAALDSDLTLDRVTLTIGQDGPGGSVDSDTAPVPMTRSSTGAPFAVSAIIRKVTNELGRRGRGRMFLPGSVSQSEVAQDGSVLPAKIADLTARSLVLYDALESPTTPETAMPPVLFHSAAPADPTPITGFAVGDLIGIQRGRIR